MNDAERELARAEAFGRIAAKGGCAITACPYEANGSPRQRVLATRWVRAYLGAGGQVAVDYGDGHSCHPIATARGQLRVTVRRTQAPGASPEGLQP